MNVPPSITYSDAKARVVRTIAKITSFVAAAGEYKGDRTNAGKRAKISKMLSDLNGIRDMVENDIQVMEKAVNQKLAPSDVTNTKDCHLLSSEFDNLYYELAAFADVYQFSLSPVVDTSSAQSVSNQSTGSNNLSHYQLPKRKFPTFSGTITEWQGFENLFKSILSHAPDLPDVERFEYLKTSLEGEALSLISHLPLTAVNYKTAWDLLTARYGNKRDLSRIHLEAIIAPYMIRSNNATSIKNFVNRISEHTAALDNLEFVTRQWSPLLVHMFEKHLDVELRGKWELSVGDRHNPQIVDFLNFLRSHVRAADARAGNQFVTDYSAGRGKPPYKARQSPNIQHHASSSSKVLATTTIQPASSSCPLCKRAHAIYKCQTFIDQSPNDRYQTAKTQRLCINCLAIGHSSAACSSKHSCKSCQKRHHSMLHFMANPSTSDSISTPTSMLVSHIAPKSVLLSTLLISIQSIHQERHTFRALLDTGAQVSFITSHCADLLSLPRHHTSMQVNAFSGAPVNVVSGRTSINMVPVGRTEPQIPLDVLIVSKITDATPQSTIKSTSWPHLNNLELADPTFHMPGPIDVLLGADIAPAVLTGHRIAGELSQPTAFGTIFGWILMGPVTPIENNSINSLLVTMEEAPLERTLTKFWEMEEAPEVHHASPDEIKAEEIFVSSVKRLDSGRFSVPLPFKQFRPILGDSRSCALKRFHYLESRLSRNTDLKKQYVDFMLDYLEKKHMEIVPKSDIETPYCYYIPHHCILRPESQTTKLRVVFDASAKTTVGQSLNSNVYTGPKLQQDLPTILIRARVHKYLFTADIQQMYRQIQIHKTDRDYLRILWRFNQELPIEEYRLCTVTYGTSCAPYQALRTLQHLAKLEQSRFPIAANVILHDTFVDDILTGAGSEEEAIECQQQLIALCAQGKFHLRKWASNSIGILRSVASSDCSMSPAVLFDDELDAGLKILGMQWNPKQDQFSYVTHTPSSNASKRSILSDLARIFDPLGFLSPVTFLAKHLIQRLWTSGIGWDDPIPEPILKIWRYVPTTENPVDCASRGLYPAELLQHPLWWTGPNFLSQEHHMWPPTSTESDVLNEEERRNVILITEQTDRVEQLLFKFSSLSKIIHIVAYCLRVFQNPKPTTIHLSPNEQMSALQHIIRVIQQQAFSDDFKEIRNRTYTGKSKLRNLSCIVDHQGIIRVGGRLSMAEIPYDQKHPILLPRTHRFTELLVDDYHHMHKHPGATTLQAIISQQYWIISSRQVIKSRLKHCIACYKTRPSSIQPFMGDLPKYRLQQVKPFINTGVDYAGPIELKSTRTRRNATIQVYICLFICMSTKALHLELASDLTTESFIMAFCRFISRRGPVEQMFSDNGTNFVGAAKLFKTVNQFTQSSEYQKKCQTYLTTRNISWHFNPPSAPHFGGLWEAGVKSVKTLLHRTLGLHRLTYEEMNTLLCRIEATLNSRPLSALSTDPADFEALTPSHFLTLMPSTAPVEPKLDSIPMSRLQRWRLLKDIHAHFWKRWQNEYLQTIQRRTKWTTKVDNLGINTLVLVREPTPPLMWKLGRILQLHPGPDGIARVATIQTAGGILKRPVIKLCPLPMC